MDEATTLAKIAAVGVSPALFVWTIYRTLPVILQAIQQFLDWKLKHNQQKADFETKEKAELAAARLHLLENLKRDLDDARHEIAGLRSEVRSLTELESDCREASAQLRLGNERMQQQNQTMIEQLSGLKAMADKTAAILRILEKMHPELFLIGGPVDRALSEVKP